MSSTVKRTPILIGLLSLASLEIINLRVYFIYWLPLIMVIVMFVVSWFGLAHHRGTYKIIAWLIPALNFLAWCGFLTIINSSFVRQLFIIIVAVSQWWYWYEGLKEIPASQLRLGEWWRTVNVLNCCTVWVIASVLYGWQSFLGWPIWWPWLMWLLCLAIIIIGDYYVSDLKLSVHWPMVVATWLILGQLFVIIYFLPSSNFVLAYLLLLAYYIFGQLNRNNLLQINTKKRLRYQIIALMLGLILVISTAKWF